MTQMIDFHAHIAPDFLEGKVSPEAHQNLSLIRKQARDLTSPLYKRLQFLQPNLRYLPDRLRHSLDQVNGLAALSTLLVESTPQDLLRSMAEHDISRAVVVAHPPFITNDFIMVQCENHPEFIPAVYISKRSRDPVAELSDLHARGARLLKLHPAADGEPHNSKRYLDLLDRANTLKMPVILHTGFVVNRVVYPSPKNGNVEYFRSWFEGFADLQFILTHMNVHFPEQAIAMAEEFPQIFLDTSWQPAEILHEAVKRVGAGRVLFASDWPLLGSNHSVALKRISDCVTDGFFTQNEADLILGGNAIRLLK